MKTDGAIFVPLFPAKHRLWVIPVSSIVGYGSTFEWVIESWSLLMRCPFFAKWWPPLHLGFSKMAYFKT